MPVNFFISRAGADAAWAQWIAKCLVDEGYSVVLQDWDFRPGQDFIAEMDRAMRDSDRTVAVLSRHYDKALFTVPEWTNAIARDPTGRNALLLPVLVDDIQPEGIFQSRVYIKLAGLNEVEARRVLLEGVRDAERKPVHSAPFPGSITARFPGALPPVWRLPFERNPLFADREEELEQLAESFASPEPPPLTVVITGTGGVGKTAMALEYAYRHRDFFKVVWWVRAEQRETLVADLGLLAEALGVAEKDQKVAEAAEEARRWLQSHDRWLLVLDDIADPVLTSVAIPQGGGGQVIATSRNPAWRRYASSVIDLGSLSEPAALELLERRSGQHTDKSSQRLVGILGALPLAVELAGSFLEQQGITAAEYLDRLKRRGDLPIDDPNVRPPDYNHGLKAIWSESIRVIGNDVPLALDLLHLAAYFAPNDIPRPMLTRGAGRLPSGLGDVAADADALSDLVARPRSYSLVASSGDGFSIHLLVQAVIRDSLDQEQRNRWAGAAALLTDYVLPRQVTDFRLGQQVERIINHAMAAAQYAADLKVEIPATVRLLDRGATFLAETGGPAAEVEQRRQDAMNLAGILPEGAPSWLLNNQAQWLATQGKIEEAEALYETAITSARRTEGGNSPSLGVTFVNLGAVLYQKDQLDKARVSLERGLAILDRLPRWAAAKRATGHSLLGQVLFGQGDKATAAVHFQIAVRDYDDSLGPGSLDAITARTFLAQARGENPNQVVTAYTITPSTLEAEEGRLLKAENAWKGDAEELLRRATDAGEPGAAVELAEFLKSQPSRQQEGDAILKNAAEAGDRQALYWYAEGLAERKDPDAETAIRRSIDAGNVYSWYDLGLLLTDDQGRAAEAETAFHKALDGGFEEARNDLGLLLLDQPGREPEGEKLLQDAGQRGQVRSWFNLAQHLRKIPGRAPEAVNTLRRAANSGYLRAFGTVAYLLEELGRLDEALAAFDAGVSAGDRDLAPHRAQFLARHPELGAGKQSVAATQSQ